MFFNTIKKFINTIKNLQYLKLYINYIKNYELYMLFNHFYIFQTYLVIELVNYFYFI